MLLSIYRFPPPLAKETEVRPVKVFSQRYSAMLTIRPARWPQDADALSAVDTSFITDCIYRLVREELSFRLDEETTTSPVRKRYDFRPADPAERRAWDFTVVAEEEGEVTGFAAAQYETWNRRVVIRHLYVAPAFRRRGVGTALLDALNDFAVSVQARCLWLETQNVNFPAIQFYRISGFRFCGFDESLYPPESLEQEEVALFFVCPV